MRPTPIECFDPVSLWPRHVFNGFTEAAEFGYKRSLISKVLKGERRTHRGLGWRLADGTSRIGEFIDYNCVLSPESSLSLNQFVVELCAKIPGVDAQRAATIMRNRFACSWESVRLSGPGGARPYSAEVARGVQWRSGPAEWTGELPAGYAVA